MRVLAIDGGGIRGLIPAIVLTEVERRTGRRVLTSVDGVLDERYASTGLTAALGEYLGDARLSDALVPLLVTAYDIEGRSAFFFRSEKARGEATYDYPLSDVAHATSAAPTYFEPALITDLDGDRSYPLIDGGVYAANPSMCAYVDLVKAGRTPDVLVSLGTGSAIRSIEYAKARNWGQLGWARSIIDVMLSGAAETVDFQLGHLLGERYFRIQDDLLLASDDLDDASSENLRNLRTEGDRMVSKHATQIDEICDKLLA